MEKGPWLIHNKLLMTRVICFINYRDLIKSYGIYFVDFNLMGHNNFIFATGIENSTPTINNGLTRIDELEKCKHYDYWQKDFDLVEEMGIKFLRYGAPLYKSFLSPG